MVNGYGLGAMNAINSKVLAAVTVIDMTEGVAGPYAAMLLGDMGARVIKVERQAGDWGRYSGRVAASGVGNPQFIALNRNKRDVGIDLETDDGRRIVERLVSSADVVVSNYRAGVMAKLGFDYARCGQLKRDIVYCTISGFGQTGAYARLPASDTIMQAMSGVMSVVGAADGPPLRVGFPLIDVAAANYAVQAVLLALYARLTGQGGANIDVSLMAAAAAIMSGSFTDYMASGRLPQRQGNQNSSLAPAGAYRVAGGQFISIAVLRDSHWVKFCAAIGRDELAADARFTTNEQRLLHRDELDAIIVPLLLGRSSAFWIDKLRAADILCGPINTIADILADPALVACLPLVDTGVPGVPRAIGTPIRYNDAYFSAELPAPAKGQHTREVLAEFGFSADEIDAFLRTGSAFAAS